VSAKKGDPRISRKYKERRLKVLAMAGYVCVYCGQVADQVDHIVPITKGGDPLAWDNLVACCKTCNVSKGNRSQGLFLGTRSTPSVFPSNPSPTRSKVHRDSPFTIRPDAEGNR
jgi:5-methylcytosine-specific restriction endonuclease McrA